MKGPRVFLYVQYLEGIGHVVRARRIAESLCQAGFQVDFIFGGYPLPEFSAGPARIHYLPPLGAGPASYSILLKPDGTPATDAEKSERCHQLLRIYSDTMPDVVITEAYPLGRWAMDFELQPLLARASATTPRPLILASVRDILQMPKTRAKADRSVELLQTYYDGLLVHGDDQIARIEESFPPLRPILASHQFEQVHYTGMVVPPAPHHSRPAGETFDVIVSAGGGAIAEAVIEAAIDAKPLSVLANSNWLALAGPRMPDAAFAALTIRARANHIALQRYHPNLTQLLADARLSIQRAGYNTVADSLIANCPMVLIPDAADQQTEQSQRAAKLAASARAVIVREDQLNGATLAAAIDSALNLKPAEMTFNFGGAARTAEIVTDLLARHQAAEHRA